MEAPSKPNLHPPGENKMKDKEKYRVALVCHNCHKERIAYIPKGIPAWIWMLFDWEECEKCGTAWFYKAMFQ